MVVKQQPGDCTTVCEIFYDFLTYLGTSLEKQRLLLFINVKTRKILNVLILTLS